MGSENAVRFLFGANTLSTQSVVSCPLDLGGIAPWLAQHTTGSFHEFCRGHFTAFAATPQTGDSVAAMFAEQVLALVMAIQQR